MLSSFKGIHGLLFEWTPSWESAPFAHQLNVPLCWRVFHKIKGNSATSLGSHPNSSPLAVSSISAMTPSLRLEFSEATHTLELASCTRPPSSPLGLALLWPSLAPTSCKGNELWTLELLPPLPEYWNYRYVLPHAAQLFLVLTFRPLPMDHKCSKWHSVRSFGGFQFI